ncbi:hypothetical protein Gasu2_25930 [Galdieria sulphuraria]|uniref:Uncharacterized protein n=1 Tax=Galdieria sulphuraria TaxID=130081 RepID=M2XZA3_GALSU|nr:uncharacterized protein Gasu_36330 [Galdieria sulphuraria]EME28894.1 hypothetical protein Gasu_36330 [Galdieria sulphuraria]GJD08283.1 hypothetical protein Gasu2_25930 [Galdieria sulphuraria]|eukprot:XP_005705414.1 hypothetical protein Gasu_36330 [Galdieria sulphuraria]
MGQQWSQTTPSYEVKTNLTCSYSDNKQKGSNQVVTVNPPPEQRQDTHRKREASLHPLLQELEQLSSVQPLQVDNSNEIRLIQETKQLADMAILKRFYSGNTVGLKGVLSADEKKHSISFHSNSLHQLATVKKEMIEILISRQEQLQLQTDGVLEKTKQVCQQLETKADQLRRVSTGIRQIEKLLVTLCDCQELLTKSLELTSEIRARSGSSRMETICSFREYLSSHAPELLIDDNMTLLPNS